MLLTFKFRKFNQLENSDEHYRERPYRCATCGQGFSQSTHLKVMCTFSYQALIKITFFRTTSEFTPEKSHLSAKSAKNPLLDIQLFGIIDASIREKR